jgi:hypothetical protein
MQKTSLNGTIAVLAAIAALAATPMTRAHAVTYDLVHVIDAGNSSDTTGYGAVTSNYWIGTYEVTIGQYAALLNAVADSDPNGLYFSNMESDPSLAGIARTGSSGAFAYAVIGPSGLTPAGAASPGNRPISYVSWFNAARFANWMSNGRPTGP